MVISWPLESEKHPFECQESKSWLDSVRAIIGGNIKQVDDKTVAIHHKLAIKHPVHNYLSKARDIKSTEFSGLKRLGRKYRG
jgi:hypothetical protein